MTYDLFWLTMFQKNLWVHILRACIEKSTEIIFNIIIHISLDFILGDVTWPAQNIVKHHNMFFLLLNVKCSWCKIKSCYKIKNHHHHQSLVPTMSRSTTLFLFRHSSLFGRTARWVALLHTYSCYFHPCPLRHPIWYIYFTSEVNVMINSKGIKKRGGKIKSKGIKWQEAKLCSFVI